MTAPASQQILQKLWNYCNVLRDDGLSYGDYVEQLTYLLFLKMAHERTQAPWSQPSFVPAQYDWTKLLAKDGDALEVQYRQTLEALARQPGMLGLIFPQDTKGGEGQYFTPRSLIQAVVECVAPKPGEAVCDPACGTGGFLLAAHDHVMHRSPASGQEVEAPPEA